MESTLDRANVIDPEALEDAVRQDQRSPAYEVLDWEKRPLSNKGLANTDGLILIRGHGKDERGETAWSLVLKNFVLEGPVADERPESLFFWERELLLNRSGLLAHLPGPIASPRCYRTTEWEKGGQAWLEFIQDSSAPRWSLEQIMFAARQLGRMSGACLAAGFLPDEPWLCHSHVRHWLELGNRLNRTNEGWEFSPLVEQIFAGSLRAGAVRLLENQEQLIQALERLPRVFSHFDFQRRNLMIRQGEGGQDQLVAIDWAFAGTGALGGELASLIGVSALLFEVEPAGLAELEAAVYPQYLAGLRESGWQGDDDRVRLGYTLWLALWCGAQAPAFASHFGVEGLGTAQFDCQPAEMVAGWAQTCAFALERGEEARRLIRKLF